MAKPRTHRRLAKEMRAEESEGKEAEGARTLVDEALETVERGHSGHDGIAFAGGSRRSAKALAFSQIPPDALRRLANRFSIGEDKYGRDNWKTSLEARDTARVWADDIYNHAMAHMLSLNDPLAERDDHLAGALWGLAALAFVETKFGCSWTEL